jgi:periplasmic protein TonB
MLATAFSPTQESVWPGPALAVGRRGGSIPHASTFPEGEPPAVLLPQRRSRAGIPDLPEARLDIVSPRPANANTPSTGMTINASERACPLSFAPRHRRLRVSAGLTSLALHVGVALAGLVSLPAPSPENAARGGANRAIDVMIIGEEELNAMIEGARAPLVQFDLQAVPEPSPPVVEPKWQLALPAPPPVPDVAHAMPADVRIPVSQELPPPLPALPQPPRQEIAPPVAPRKKPIPTAMPRRSEPRKKQARRPAPVPKTASTARGHSGSGTQATTRTATVRGGSGGAAPTAGSAAWTGYRSRVVAHLTRFKTYPEQARDRGIVGRNAITITLARDGRVAASSLSASSGQSMLDAATLAALRRAQPFPAMPEGGPATFTVTIGLRYDLK